MSLGVFQNLKSLMQMIWLSQVPNMFAPDEKQEIADKMRAIDRQKDKSKQTDGSPVALFNMFIGKIEIRLSNKDVGCYNSNKDRLLQPCLLLFFGGAPFLLPACHNVNCFVASSFSCTIVIFPSSYCILYRVDGLELIDTILYY